MTKTITSILIYSLLIGVVGAFGQRPVSPNFRLVDNSKGGSRGQTVQEDESKQIRLEGNFSVPGAKNVRDAASKFLASNSRQLKINDIYSSRGASELRVVDEAASLTGTHLTYQQFYDKLPVFNEHAKVSVNKQLQITQVTSNIAPVPASRGLNTKPNTADDAAKAAITAVGSNSAPARAPKVEPGVIMDSEGTPSVVYRVTFSTRSPGASWEVFVDAKSSKVISTRNRAMYLTGKGMVFSPNPIVSSLGKGTFEDNDDADSPALNAQRIPVILNDLDASGTLSGLYATTEPTDSFTRAKSRTRTFNFTRSDDRFEEVMAYHYVTESARYLKLIGFNPTAIFKKRPLPIVVNGTEDQNAYFDPGTIELVFGTGGVDAAEDGTVVVHEFGHALLDQQAPTFIPGSLTEGGAMHEGFGDYLSATFFYKPTRGAWNKYLGSWFAAGIDELQGNSPLFLRTLDTPKRYPTDLDRINEPHNNGEIWAATLWDIFTKLGKRTADRLIIESNFRLTGKAGFFDAAKNILQVDRELNRGVNEKALRDIFTKRGILGSPAVNLGATSWAGADFGRDPNTPLVRYSYEFRSNGTATVSVQLSGSAVTCVDDTARFTQSANQIGIVIDNGTIQQDGSINGNALAGQTAIFLGGTGTSKFSQCLNKALGKGDWATLRWSASKAP